MFRNILRSAAVFSLTATSAFATTYFVSSSTGDDANDGLSEASAFRSLDQIESIELRPGDSVLFRRGDTWRGQLDIRAPGTKEDPVTFSNYGDPNDPNPLILSALLIDDWENLGNNLFQTSIGDSVPHHVIVRTAEGNSLKLKRRNKGRETEEGAFGWEKQPDGSHLLFVHTDALEEPGAYVDIAHWDHAINASGTHGIIDGIDGAVSNWVNIFVRGSGKPWEIKNLQVQYGWGSNRRTPGGGIEVRSVDGTVIDNVTVKDSHGDGIFVRCTNTTVQNSRIYTVYKGFNPGGDSIQFSSARTDGFRILNNWMTQKGTDTPKGCIQQEFGDNGIVRGNVISYGVFGIEVNGNNIIIEDNIVLFPGVDRAGEDPFSAGIYMSEHRGYDNILIRNNVVFGADQNGIGLEATNGRKFPPYDRTNIRILNNTIIGSGRSSLRTTVGFSGEIKNNIFWGGRTAVDIANIVYNSPFEMDYNLLGSSNQTLIEIGNKQWSSVEAFNEDTGNSGNSVIGEPFLENMNFPLIANPTPSDPLPELRPTAESLVIDAGIFVGYRKDITGALVPQGNRVDVGAYESPFARGEAPPLVAPVTNLEARPIAQDEIRIEWENTDPNSAGFLLRRSDDPAKEGKLLRPLVYDTVFFDADGLEFGTPYFYEVAAVNAAGRPSKYQVIETATLPPPPGFIVYEPFRYQTNNILEGKNGGYGFGGPWTSEGTSKITEGSVGSSHTNTNGNGVEFWESHKRNLRGTLSTERLGTIWIGAVFGSSHDSKFAELRLIEDGETVVAVNSRPGNRMRLNGEESSAFVPDSPPFVAIRLQDVPGGTEADVWINPELNASPGTEPQLSTLLPEKIDFDAIGFYFSHGSDHRGLIDEIRIGRNFANTWTSRVPDQISPDQPVNLQAEVVGTSRTRLTWSPNRESDLSHYVLLRDTEPQFTARQEAVVAERIESAAFVDSELPVPGVSYFYRVAAVDLDGNYSSPSEIAIAEVPPPSGTLLFYEPFEQAYSDGDTADTGNTWTFTKEKESAFVRGSLAYPGIETNGGKISVVGGAALQLSESLEPEDEGSLWIGFVMEERNSGRTGTFSLGADEENWLIVSQKPNQLIEINGEKTEVQAHGGFQFFLMKLEANGQISIWIDPDLESGEPSADSIAHSNKIAPPVSIEKIGIGHYPASLFSVYVDEIRIGRSFLDAIQGSRVR